MTAIREACRDDLDAINAIYNDVLMGSTAIYADIPMSLPDREAWWQARRAAGFPTLVAVEGGAIAGFASLGEFRAWPGYRYTVEGTLHVSAAHRRTGVGSLLLRELITAARAMGKHVLIAGVDSENVASLAFLERHGFERVGCLKAVGFKFGRFLNLHLLEYFLSEGSEAEPAQA